MRRLTLCSANHSIHSAAIPASTSRSSFIAASELRRRSSCWSSFREARKLAALRRERGRTKKRRENNDPHRRLFGDAYTLSARFRRILKVTLLPHTIECAARLTRVGKIAVTGTLIRKCNLRVQSDALPFGVDFVTLGSRERVAGVRTRSNSLDQNRSYRTS